MPVTLRNPFKRRPVAGGPSRLPGRLLEPKNVESELEPSDIDWVAPPPGESEEETVEFVTESFRSASQARILLEREWLRCYAFRMGNQWFAWKPKLNRFMSLRDPNDDYRNYVTVNYVRPLITKLKVRSTMTRPDASVKPLTDDPQDVAAAAEARDLGAHYDLMFSRQVQLQQWVDAALVLSTSFLKIAWDPQKGASTAYHDFSDGPSARPTIVKDAPIGDLVESIVPSFEVYPDPTARSWEECPWLIHAKYYPLSWFQTQFSTPEPGYPKGRGWAVKAEPQGTSSETGWWEWRLNEITGNRFRQSVEGKAKEACLYEMWQKPTPKYPKGRFIRVASGVLLTAPSKCDWPYDKWKEFPFIPLGYGDAYGTLWSMNATLDLLDPQYNINKTYSRLQDRIDTDTPVVLCKKGVEIDSDDYTSDRNYRKVYWDGAVPPQYDAPPAVSEMYLALIQAYKREMEDSVGMHEPSNGDTPPGVTAGTAIELLQQSDHTQLAEFIGNIEKAQTKRFECEIAICSEKYNEPRLVMVSQSGPEKATANARAFRALRNGGLYRVEVLPGSAMPKTPAARKQEWMDLLGILSRNPNLLPFVKIVYEYIGFERSDIMSEKIDQAIAEMVALQKASEPDPQAMQQQQHQAQAEQIQLKEQLAQTMEAIKLHADLIRQQAKTQGDIAIAGVKSDADMRQRDHTTSAVMQENEHQAELTARQHMVEAAMPKTVISVKAGPKGTVGAEEMANFPVVDDPDTLTKLATKPAPAKPGATGGANGK